MENLKIRNFSFRIKFSTYLRSTYELASNLAAMTLNEVIVNYIKATLKLASNLAALTLNIVIVSYIKASQQLGCHGSR